MNKHPKNAQYWRPGTSGFFRHKYGASKMKWHFQVPYRRKYDSLFHYPEVSKVTGQPVDWYHGEPQDGYEAARLFGDNTIELRGMPMGRTPEYMQERLRRFFSKFGPVKHCRAEPHPLDPYQCEGSAFVSFRDKAAAAKAIKAPLKFPASLHDKVVAMRSLDTDKCNDPNYHEKMKFLDHELVGIARQLHVQLSSSSQFRDKGKPLAIAGHGILQRDLVQLPVREEDSKEIPGRGGAPLSRGLHGAPTRNVIADEAVVKRFGRWEEFLAEPPLDELFKLAVSSAATSSNSLVVLPRLVSTVQRNRILLKTKRVLDERRHKEFSVWWREGRVPLPEYTQRRVMWWDHKPPLPFALQIQSRSKDRVRIHDEKFLFKMQLRRDRKERQREGKALIAQARKQSEEAKAQALDERRKLALEEVHGSSRHRGLSQGLLSPGEDVARQLRAENAPETLTDVHRS